MLPYLLELFKHGGSASAAMMDRIRVPREWTQPHGRVIVYPKRKTANDPRR